ncbi:MAG: hypothetical protein Q8P26_03895 [Candidatus Levybacteria bacterium]|nr:hypothetical protein [Candidatus Levybacteria bacterium]
MPALELGRKFFGSKKEICDFPHQAYTEPAKDSEKTPLLRRCNQIIEQSEGRIGGTTGEEFHEFAVNMFKLTGGVVSSFNKRAKSNPLLDEESGFKITIELSIDPRFKTAKMLFEPIDPNNKITDGAQQESKFVSEKVYYGVSNYYPPSPENRFRKVMTSTEYAIPHKNFSHPSFIRNEPQVWDEADPFISSDELSPRILPGILKRVLGAYTSQSQTPKA